MRLLSLCLMLLVSACSAHHQVVQGPVVNPYRAQAEALARSGVDALGMGRWQSAQRLFEKSLRSASLTGDSKLMALAWYNLGRAREAGGDVPGAREAFVHAMQLSGQAQEAVNRQRAALALALLERRNGVQLAGRGTQPYTSMANEDRLLVVPKSFPIDIHLAAAQLAALRDRPRAARKAYASVLDMAGKDRSGLIYAARARLGLATIDGTSDRDEARRQVRLAVALLERAGEPRLMVQALRMAAAYESDPASRTRWLQRADAVKQAWREAHPQ